MDHTHDVFLSYSSLDKPVVADLADRLRAGGLRVWFDEWELQPGDSIPSRIEAGLEGSAVLVLCLSEHSLGSDWAALEGQTFRFRDPLNRDRRFVPVRLDDVKLTGSLAQFLYVDWRERDEEQFERLMRACEAPGSDTTTTPAGTLTVDTDPALARVISLGHTDWVRGVAYSPDGAHAITGSDDRTVRVWDLTSGHCLNVLEGHTESVSAVAYSPHGTHAISGSNDRTLRVWDLTNGHCVNTLAGHTNWVRDVAYSPDGTHAISGSSDGTLRVWDLTSGYCVHILEGHTDAVTAVAYSPHGTHAITNSDRGTLRVWDLTNGHCVNTLKGHTRGVTAIAYSPDGTHAITNSDDRTLRVWDLTNEQCVHILEGHTRGVTAIAYSPDGTHAISGSSDRTVRVWDLTNGHCVNTLEGHTDWVRDVAYDPNGARAISGSDDGTVRVWDLTNGHCVNTLEGHTDEVNAVAYNPHSTHAITSSNDHTARVWDLTNGHCVNTLEGHTESANAVAYNPDGRHAITGSSDRTVRVWDLTTGHCVQVFEGHTDEVTGVAYSPDGTHAISGSDDRTVRVWDLTTGHCVNILKGHTDEVTAVTYSPDGTHAISGSSDRTVRVWDLTNGHCVNILEGHTDWVRDVAYNPDGTRAISGSDDDTVRVWDLTTGHCVQVFEGHTDEVTAVAYSSDGETVLSVTINGVLRVWGALPAGSVDHSKGVGQISYTNAKVVLVGEHQAGKSGLAMRLAHDRWEPTDSTIGAWATQFEVPHGGSVTQDGVEREVWLWDFGGQADQRLIHQLYLGDTALAVVVFDGQKEDAVPRLWDWNRALASAGRQFPKVLVAGRTEINPVRLAASEVNEFCDAAGFAGYLETSAKDDVGCSELREAIVELIDWRQIPWRSAPEVFQRLKSAVMELKDAGRILVSVKELRDWLPSQVGAFEAAELDAVIGLLAGPGAVLPLEFGDYVLLQPEQLNAYAQCVIQSLRDDPLERGCIAEERVLRGELNYHRDFQRLDVGEELIVLRAMHKQLIDHSICLRDIDPGGTRATQLVFPSYFRRERPQRPDSPQAFVSYRFTGYLDEIYASLVVRLHHSERFRPSELWRYAADMQTIDGHELGIRLTVKPDRSGELELHCDPSTPTKDQVVFASYVQEHLKGAALDVTGLRTYICPKCGTAVENRETARRRLLEGKLDIACVSCDDRIELQDDIERLLSDAAIRERVEQLQETAQIILDNESVERILVANVMAIIRRAGQIEREVMTSDVGIDMEIEFKDDNGAPTGKRVYLQLKAGDSHLRSRKRDAQRIFQINKPRHADYWADQECAMLLVVGDSSDSIEWMEIGEPLRQQRDSGDWPARQIVFQGQRFDVAAVLGLRDQALQSPHHAGSPV